MYNTWSSVLTVLTVAALSAGFSTPSHAADDPARLCLELPQIDFAGIPDAATHVSATELVEADSNLPEYCKVEGYISPHIRFELHLPTTEWNGRFFMQGCGGFCGFIRAHRSNDALAQGFATISSDLGNPSTAVDGKWAYNNRQAEIDFGYRGTHVTVLAAKGIIDRFYGRRPDYSYYRGCSTGGRQGMVEAQRFPNDFDGIVAGAMPFDETAAGALNLLWPLHANRDENGNAILGTEDAQLLYDAAVSRCDDDDGVVDGIIADPLSCDFDPVQLRCTTSSQANCLTDRQISVAHKIYEGPQNSDGTLLTIGGPPPGSELRWASRLEAAGEEGKVYWGTDFVRFMAFMEDPGPTYGAYDFDYDVDPPRLAMMEVLYSASNHDLRAFKKSGGKLIMYHGLQDSIPPEGLIDYYETAERVIGSPSAMRDFARMFFIPGMNHCYGGPGADTVDYLSAIIDWVENGEAPDRLVGHHLHEAQSLRYGYEPFPLDPDNIAFTRPIFPYPDQARYSGRGDVNDGDNWQRMRP